MFFTGKLDYDYSLYLIGQFQHVEGMDKPQPIILLFLLPPMLMADDQMDGVKKQNHVMNCSRD